MALSSVFQSGTVHLSNLTNQMPASTTSRTGQASALEPHSFRRSVSIFVKKPLSGDINLLDDPDFWKVPSAKIKHVKLGSEYYMVHCESEADVQKIMNDPSVFQGAEKSLARGPRSDQCVVIKGMDHKQALKVYNDHLRHLGISRLFDMGGARANHENQPTVSYNNPVKAVKAEVIDPTARSKLISNGIKIGLFLYSVAPHVLCNAETAWLLVTHWQTATTKKLARAAASIDTMPQPAISVPYAPTARTTIQQPTDTAQDISKRNIAKPTMTPHSNSKPTIRTRTTMTSLANSVR